MCTYRRPEKLARLLETLDRQTTKGLFRFSIVVVDNDACESARSVIENCVLRLRVPIEYQVEPRQNIALARNTSVARARGEFVAFIDDDEEPSDDWLLRLYETLLEHRADGVLGPVLPKFEESAPSWAVNGQVFQRPGFKTGTVIPWRITGTGNALIRREVLLGSEGPFDPQLGAGGEDTDFFRRAMERGKVFVWSAEAVCYEYVPPERTRVAFQLRRALLRGKVASRTTGNGWYGVLKSTLAVALYTILLPVSLLAGSHIFVTYLVKAFDHLGKLLALCRIDIVGDKYITS
jgi:succinoglycan biosynthesis protein ExoM